MRNDELSNQSLNFAVSIINLVKDLKAKHETAVSNRIGRSGTSIRVMPIAFCRTAKENQPYTSF